ncbi:MAG TPA: hypothetical protein VK841_25185 [Polyangiaceae bacterium]|nr:hypothetical protein [Polyangiaceae bacterium]
MRLWRGWGFGAAGMTRLAACLVAGLAAVAIQCSTYSDCLGRGRKAFDAGEHERALAIFRSMQNDVESLSPSERALYGYLRGMTDYRIGYRAEARHWLALASESAKETPGSLPPDMSKRLVETLSDLNEQVYSQGVTSLSNTVVATPAVAPGEETDETDEGRASADGGAEAAASPAPAPAP